MGMLGRIAIALASALLLTSASVGAVGAVGAVGVVGADPYSTKVTTKTVVTTPSPIRTDTRVDISVKVTTNSPQTPKGSIRLTLSAAPDGAGQGRSAAGPAGWTRTIRYDGGTDQVRGPAFPRTGHWLVRAVFTPDGNTFRGSRDGWVFEVIAGSDNDPGGDDDDGGGGLLPDAGGPALLWLLLGIGLVGGGAAAVVVARRRRTGSIAA